MVSLKENLMLHFCFDYNLELTDNDSFFPHFVQNLKETFAAALDKHKKWDAPMSYLLYVHFVVKKICWSQAQNVYCDQWFIAFLIEFSNNQFDTQILSDH